MTAIKKMSILLLTILPLELLAQEEKVVYLFVYFIENGEDGLHLAYSHDGLQWAALKNNTSFLTPEVELDRLLRDPCKYKALVENFIWCDARRQHAHRNIKEPSFGASRTRRL